jgi:hypothetical protein
MTGDNFRAGGHVCPGGVVNPGLSQPGYFKPGVVNFSKLIIAGANRAKAGLPGCIAGDNLIGAVRIKQMQLREQPRLGAVIILAVKGAIAAIPAVAQNGSQGI